MFPLRLPAFGEFILSKKTETYKLMSVPYSCLSSHVALDFSFVEHQIQNQDGMIL